MNISTLHRPAVSDEDISEEEDFSRANSDSISVINKQELLMMQSHKSEKAVGHFLNRILRLAVSYSDPRIRARREGPRIEITNPVITPMTAAGLPVSGPGSRRSSPGSNTRTTNTVTATATPLIRTSDVVSRVRSVRSMGISYRS
ncbi:hypothetical protein [Salinibaculum salinum]|uniref:hypothetical protein n=1 Tax=Salinibaculum salinum TaxID=3131996 RepID=UPI0030EB93EB